MYTCSGQCSVMQADKKPSAASSSRGGQSGCLARREKGLGFKHGACKVFGRRSQRSSELSQGLADGGCKGAQ
jgi:hypothetical protein